MAEVTVASLLDDDGLRRMADIVETAQQAHQRAAEQLAAAEAVMQANADTQARVNATAATLNARQYEASAECVRLILADDTRGLGPARAALEKVRSERSLYLEAIDQAAAQIRTGRRAFLEARLESEVAEAELLRANVELRTAMKSRLALPIAAMDGEVQIMGGNTEVMRQNIAHLREIASNTLGEIDVFEAESIRIQNGRKA
jgi:hypothetical protein